MSSDAGVAYKPLPIILLWQPVLKGSCDSTAAAPEAMSNVPQEEDDLQCGQSLEEESVECEDLLPIQAGCWLYLEWRDKRAETSLEGLVPRCEGAMS